MTSVELKIEIQKEFGIEINVESFKVGTTFQSYCFVHSDDPVKARVASVNAYGGDYPTLESAVINSMERLRTRLRAAIEKAS